MPIQSLMCSIIYPKERNLYFYLNLHQSKYFTFNPPHRLNIIHILQRRKLRLTLSNQSRVTKLTVSPDFKAGQPLPGMTTVTLSLLQRLPRCNY